jgi:predicted short-subunit dehydrogenase-like oxidoreductase (DUF2520 family)
MLPSQQERGWGRPTLGEVLKTGILMQNSILLNLILNPSPVEKDFKIQNQSTLPAGVRGFMKISFIGSGNVAWHLALAFENAGHSVLEVFSRDISKAKHLASYLYNAKAKADLDFSESKAELFILAVSDDAMAEVCSKIELPQNAVIAHTSGSKSLTDLQNLMNEYHETAVECAVFYPLMTFSAKVKVEIKEVPFCIEAYQVTICDLLVKLAQQLSKTVYLVNSSERKVLHIGAVFACNFTNHLLGLAQYILEKENLEFDLLKPLIKETTRKSLTADHAADVQTGPAVRGDNTIIKKHLGYLSNEDDLYKVYQTLTNSIQEWHEI